MDIANKAKHILVELKGHAPFTALGAVLGIIFMLLLNRSSDETSHILFSIFHPGHVLLSALVTASMFGLHAKKKKFITVLIIGYLGSIGISSLSDVILPHKLSGLLGMNIPSHSEVHNAFEHSEKTDEASLQGESKERNHNEDNKMHFGFIKEWYLVNPAAIIGILIAYFLPHTKFPHSGHILISTWASSAYLLMRTASEITLVTTAVIFTILFISVWIPCVISDIVFPLLFVKSDIELAGPCPEHVLHSHPHLHLEQECEK